MSRFCISYSHFSSKNISVYVIFNDQSFNNTLTNNIVSFEQLGSDQNLHWGQFWMAKDANFLHADNKDLIRLC